MPLSAAAAGHSLASWSIISALCRVLFRRGEHAGVVGREERKEHCAHAVGECHFELQIFAVPEFQHAMHPSISLTHLDFSMPCIRLFVPSFRSLPCCHLTRCACRRCRVRRSRRAQCVCERWLAVAKSTVRLRSILAAVVRSSCCGGSALRGRYAALLLLWQALSGEKTAESAVRLRLVARRRGEHSAPVIGGSLSFVHLLLWQLVCGCCGRCCLGSLRG